MEISIIEQIISPYLSSFKDGEGYFEDDERRIKYFRHNPTNTDPNEVLLKISAMDSTEIDQTIRNREVVADHITALQIDGDLQQGLPEVVNRIALLKFNGTSYNLYSFASRYCNWHRLETYPIYDETMDKILRLYMKNIKSQEISDDELAHYPSYKSLMEEVRSALNLSSYNYKELDKFIWIHGNKIVHQLANLQQ